MGSIKDDIFSRLSPPAQMPELGRHGLYALCLRERHDLPGVTVGAQRVLYVGKTKDLLKRNHFRYPHSGKSSPRRSLGALLRESLNLKPIRRDSNPKNADKYRFTGDGEARLIDWMNTSLLIGQVEVIGDVTAKETALIRELEPPLNLTEWKNPQAAFILSRRRECANIVLAGFGGVLH